ncbi:PaaI family thioesterase [Vreelandella malpeensis]|uniref:PaaI family thioesterase n=1 Tax=Vreelandella malpeensis TaxID=1172368 RepID=A0ABS8DWJ6_9GAMM|nr:PaaI family thioesterase [Halomonas malpeensis]MCB8890722.1 PaaI family thioesterase [Halomonas malpeensis]
MRRADDDAAQGPQDEPGGFNDLLGLCVVEWSETRAVVEMRLEEKHFNRSGNVHGGVLCSLLDNALSLTGLYCSVQGNARRAVTLSLSTTFVGPARHGVLRAVGELRGGGHKIYMASAEVTDEQGNLVAMGEGSFKRLSGSESPQGVPVAILKERLKGRRE